MACSWSKQPFYLGAGKLNDVNDAVIGGQLTTVPNGNGANQGQQTLPGDHAVLDETTALALSDTAVGTLHGGYFQYVQLDPTIAGIGAIVETITITAPGTGYAAATTTVTFSAAPAGGRTAQGVAVIASTGVIVAISVTDQGQGYIAAPTVTIASTGAGAGATATAAIQAAVALIPNQALYWKSVGLNNTVYVVTPVQTLNTNNFAGVLLNPSWTPGNYGWIQNLGRVTVLVDAASTAITPGLALYLSAATGASNGSFINTAGTAGAFSGIAEGWVITGPVAGSTVLANIQKASLRF